MIVPGIIALLCASALFSASEIVFVSANKSKCNVRARKNGIGARIAVHFFDNPEHFFTTVLVGNTIANASLTSLAALVLVRYGWSDSAILAVVSLVLLLLGEMIPKAFARMLADLFIDLAAMFVQACFWLLFPIIWTTKTVSQQVILLFDSERSSISSFFNKKEFAVILHESEESGAVDSQARSQISKAVTLSDVMIKDVMVPRTEIIAVEESATVDEAVATMLEHGYSKLLVYRENIDHIIGVIIGRDLFRQPGRLAEILRPIIVVPTTGNCSDLFRNFRLKNISLAVVVDEFGGTAGVVTSNDVLRQFLGEIMEDDTEPELTLKRLSDGSYLIAGNVDTSVVREQVGVKIPDGPFDTIAGYLLFKLGRIPLEREIIPTDLGVVTIVKATKMKIEFIRLKPIHATTRV
jgi:putative hemolysin